MGRPTVRRSGSRLAAGWGYDGLEIACSGDHLDVERGAVDDDYIAGRGRFWTDTDSRYTPSRCICRARQSAMTRSMPGTEESFPVLCGVTATRKVYDAAPRRR